MYKWLILNEYTVDHISFQYISNYLISKYFTTISKNTMYFFLLSISNNKKDTIVDQYLHKNENDTQLSSYKRSHFWFENVDSMEEASTMRTRRKCKWCNLHGRFLHSHFLRISSALFWACVFAKHVQIFAVHELGKKSHVNKWIKNHVPGCCPQCHRPLFTSRIFTLFHLFFKFIFISALTSLFTVQAT